ncbi:MAG: hypothetical protein WA584_06580 [Pyrinomonadaceae bacterium]
MKKQKLRFLPAALLILLPVLPIWAQKSTPKPVIFAVTDDGQRAEPIAEVNNGKLVETVDGGAEDSLLKTFAETYYKPKTNYRLIFGGADAGTVMIKSSDTTSECGKNMAQTTFNSTKAKLKGSVMALATNVESKGSGLRRMPTAAERTELEKLVRAEFTKQKISAKVLKTLRYQNLTALDVDNDKNVEFVGSYWVAPSATTRALLFFIAEKNKNGKYVLAQSKYNLTKQADVMSKNIKDVDDGIYHELLLDALDFDGDGVSEIFTIGSGFEGVSFYVYGREAGKWKMIFEGGNYHCAY